jgi:hypothetical protein
MTAQVLDQSFTSSIRKIVNYQVKLPNIYAARFTEIVKFVENYINNEIYFEVFDESPIKKLKFSLFDDAFSLYENIFFSKLKKV